MSKHTELRKHLELLGISRNNMRNGTVNGLPAVFLYKDGKEAQFTGHTDAQIFSGLAKLRDERLKEDFASDPAAVNLGSRGGSVTSDAKAAAARRNGRKGGRPRKKSD